MQVSVVYQCNETNVMHFLFNFLRIKCLNVFRVLHAHPQEVLHKRDLVYCVRVMSVVYETAIVTQSPDITCTQYTKSCLFSAS
jgi:hypothetical protein